jgi:hypothetical protein
MKKRNAFSIRKKGIRICENNEPEWESLQGTHDVRG